jgi:DNA-binding LytR/AlgR family response regulator
MQYFEVMAVSFQYISLSLVIPYLVLALSLRIYEYSNSASSESSAASQRMRFYDEKHNLKIVLDSQSIFYIEADVNYVNIFYTENGKLRHYVLRSSMKALEELCQDNGLVRCHRSYYVNPAHIKVLRKDKEGVVFAELNANETIHIPVTKRYYGHLSDLL